MSLRKEIILILLDLISRNGETPWDLVKDKNTEEIFYVHFDRNDLKKIGKLEKDEPLVEIEN